MAYRFLVFIGALATGLAGAAQVRKNTSHIPKAPRQMTRRALEKNEISAQAAKEHFAREIMQSPAIVKSKEVVHDVAKALTPELLQRIRNLSDWEESVEEQLRALKLVGIDAGTTPGTPFQIEGIAYRTALEDSRYKIRMAHLAVLHDLCRAVTGAKGIGLTEQVGCRIKQNWFLVKLLRDGVSIMPGQNQVEIQVSPRDIFKREQAIQGIEKKPADMSDLRMYFQLDIRGDEKEISPHFATMVNGVFSSGEDLDAPIGTYLAKQMPHPEDAKTFESVTNSSVVRMSGQAAFTAKSGQ